MTDAAQIAKGLTEAQRVVIAMVWRRKVLDLDEAWVRKTTDQLEAKMLITPNDDLTDLGRAVAEEMEG